MTSIEYSNILRQKTLNKKVTKKVKQQKRNEKENKKDKWVVDSMNVDKRAIQKLAKKCAWTNFISTWSTTTIKNEGDKFHWNFIVG